MTDEDSIRAKAYELWEQAGSPEDAPSETFWHRARSLLEAKEGGANLDSEQSGPDSGSDDLESGADPTGSGAIPDGSNGRS